MIPSLKENYLPVPQEQKIVFSFGAKRLYDYILDGCVTLPVLSHYFWGNTDNVLESAEPGHMARGTGF